jgi:hypothetical protein
LFHLSSLPTEIWPKTSGTTGGLSYASDESDRTETQMLSGVREIRVSNQVALKTIRRNIRQPQTIVKENISQL